MHKLGLGSPLVTVSNKTKSSFSLSATATRSAIGSYTVTGTNSGNGQSESVPIQIFDTPPQITSVSQSGPLPQGGQTSVQVIGQYLGLRTGHLNFCVSGSNPCNGTSDLQVLSYSSWTDSSVTAQVQASPTALGGYDVDVASSGANGNSFRSNPGSGQTSQSQPKGTVTVSSRPIISGPNQSTSVAFWYLGGAPTIDGFYTYTVLTVTPPNNGDPTPTIQWSTDSPGKLSITPASDGLSATVTATGASAYNNGMPQYDVHVTVDYDGIPSDPFPLLINTPYQMSRTGPNQSGTCTDMGLDEPEFVEKTTYKVLDLQNNPTVVPITTNETLENPQYLGAYANGTISNWTAVLDAYTLPGSIWAATPADCNGAPNCLGHWIGNTFEDFFYICKGQWNPAQQPYGSGTDVVLNLTQKFFVGSPTHWQGACAQEAVITLYRDHATLSGAITPVPNQQSCAQGTFIN